MAVYPFILVHKKDLKTHPSLINHEKIHLRQQAELLVLPFFVWYFMEYLLLLIVYRNHHQAYRNISFEREAYDNETKLNYLSNRPLWSFAKYFNNHR